MRKIFERMAALVRECCDPDEIFLFGSFAKGIATVDSDVDLIVVGDFGARKAVVRQEIAETLSQFPLGVDVLLLSPREIAEAAGNPQAFLASALSSSILLYRRGPETG
ncbi:MULTISPECIES: nucleotidyltransferase domain-containing protein [unclassified Mesorhizobium]|uniref:nucleotidyltransferase domain-containing protein n=1 Tax=unclassified Mesorhizobium TaxID=325217 RepID=UPI00333A53A2